MSTSQKKVVVPRQLLIVRHDYYSCVVVLTPLSIPRFCEPVPCPRSSDCTAIQSLVSKGSGCLGFVGLALVLSCLAWSLGCRSRVREGRNKGPSVGRSLTKKVQLLVVYVAPHGRVKAMGLTPCSSCTRSGCISRWVSTEGLHKYQQEGGVRARCVRRLLKITQSRQNLSLKYVVDCMVWRRFLLS